MRQRIPWILLGAMLVAGMASVVSLLADERYSASASLQTDATGAGSGARTDRAAAVLEPASHDVIARRAERRLERRGDFVSAAAVSTVEMARSDQSDLIEVTAEAGRAAAAAAAANAFADEYVAFGREAEQRARALRARSRDLRALASIQPNAVVVERARPPASPSSPRPVRNTLIGGLAGLLFGLGLTFARDRLDRRLRDPGEFEEALGLPVLTRLPDSEALGRRLGMAHDLPPTEAEAFQALRQSLGDLGSPKIDSVLVTSAAARDGKSTVAFNLAAAAAATDLDVLLIEAEVERQTLGRSLGLPSNRGLTSVLAGEIALADACHELLLVHNRDSAGLPATMDVLLAGHWRRGAAELVESARMRKLIEECRRTYSLVVIDTPPPVLVGDADPLMSAVSAVIVVGRVGKLKSEQAARLRDRLEKVRAPTLGVVANFAEWRRDSARSSFP